MHVEPILLLAAGLQAAGLQVAALATSFHLLAPVLPEVSRLLSTDCLIQQAFRHQFSEQHQHMLLIVNSAHTMSEADSLNSACFGVDVLLQDLV